MEISDHSVSSAADTGQIAGACDTWFRPDSPARGVVIVTHGLNLNPARMDDLARFLAASGFEVFRPAFTGHCWDNEKHLYAKADEWEQDARRFHAAAKKRAGELRVPLSLCAYSFSGLIFQSLSAELPFARRVYFAPALAVRFWYPLLLLFARLWPSLTYRTRIPEGYFANGISGQRCLLAFHHFLLRWRAGHGHDDPAPALIWAAPRDELVHAGKLRALAARRPGWIFRELSVAGSTLPKSYHHLVIDEAALGGAEWKRVTELTAAFLNEKAPAAV